MEDLNKCKDCGADAQLKTCNLGFYVECCKLGHLHNGEAIYKTKEEAIAAWNRRVTQNIGEKECSVQGEEQEG